LLSLILVLGLRLAASAQEEGEPKSRLERPDVAEPLIYSVGLMTLGLPLLMAAGTYENGASLNNFEDAFESGPEWEDDSAIFNFVLHPLWGSETYLRAREARWGLPGSIAFSLGMSVTWEYLIESWTTHPSAQDLIITTGAGWLIGEARYRLKARASERWDWMLDPIHTTLDRLKVRFTRDRDGDVETLFTLSWKL
jgi:hypothetical protein